MSSIRNEHILKCIPLMASVLSDKYGVHVEIGGDTAMADGDTIYLPNLPLTCSDDFINLLRGYMDHEAAHIRYTDFKLLQECQLSEFEHFVWNCIEDWRVEKKMAEHFVGCKTNFQWLIHHVFYRKTYRVRQSIQKTLSEWLLLYIRAWDVQSLQPQVHSLEKHIKSKCPQLLKELGVLLCEVRKACDSPQDAIHYAKSLVACIEHHVQSMEQTSLTASLTTSSVKSNGQTDNIKQGGTTAQAQPEEVLLQPKTQAETDEFVQACSLRELRKRCFESSQTSDSQLDLPTTSGERAAQLIEKQKEHHEGHQLIVATLGKKHCEELSSEQMQRALRVSTTLKAKLQGLLQAQSLVRRNPARQGKINCHRLHNLAVNDNRVFLQQQIGQTTDTAVHVLFDTSGSMYDNMNIANEACFALASALGNMKGVNLGITAFPALIGESRKHHAQTRPAKQDQIYVFPVVKHGEKCKQGFHRHFQLRAEGSTPLTEALWWVIPTILKQKEQRKMLLLITDGEPDQRISAIHALKTAEQLGIEIYGIGILSSCIEDLLSNLQQQRSVIIDTINILPKMMFELLQSALIKHRAR